MARAHTLKERAASSPHGNLFAPAPEQDGEIVPAQQENGERSHPPLHSVHPSPYSVQGIMYAMTGTNGLYPPSWAVSRQSKPSEGLLFLVMTML